ncbi:MAG: exopolyphosphatase [Planctomycetaceae bacterium]
MKSKQARMQDRVRPVAVIDIGASSIRMAIAEIKPDGSVRILERLVQGVSLGKDTFTRRVIRKSTIEECVKVLRAYQQKLLEYQFTENDQIRVVATSAVREATNRLRFLDRIYIATGLTVEPINEAEIARITYLGIQPKLEAEPSLANKATIIAEVGGGTTDILILKEGDVVHSHNYRLGALRLRETIKSLRSDLAKVRGVMESHIDRTLDEIQEHVDVGKTQLLALGGDIRFAASQLSSKSTTDIAKTISVSELRMFTTELLKSDVDRIIRRYHLSLPDAESLGPALLAYLRMAERIGAEEILVSDFTLREAVLNEMAARRFRWSEEFQQQILKSALELGRRYSINEPHALHVAKLAQTLFHELAEEHRLTDPRYELILRVAAVVHEVGLFISLRGYHKHSHYLVSNSEIFGLSPSNLQLVALVARYHRRASPKPTHEGYSVLSRRERIVVCKLAAILRVADALDHSRSQRIKDPQCEVQGRRLVVSVSDVEDVSLEQLELRQKGALFEETYGLRVLLRHIR